MKVGIYGQSNNEITKKYINLLVDILIKNKVTLVFEKKFFDFYIESNPKIKHNTFDSYDDLDNSFDLFFSVGGDGTFLRSVSFVRDLNIPIIGINTGRLGFLATIKTEKLSDSINLIINKQYIIKERTLISVTTKNKNTDLKELNFALNEITVFRKNTASMIAITAILDDEYLTTYFADGLIIATPTGSTGYSLSCGGPVISPSSKNLVITPIAPHSLIARPLVIPDETKIVLKVDSREHEALLSLDSRQTTVSNDDEIYIEKCNFTIKMVQLNDQSFIKTLREKLFWGEDKRN